MKGIDITAITALVVAITGLVAAIRGVRQSTKAHKRLDNLGGTSSDKPSSRV